MFVYSIINLDSGKRYIGQTNDVARRFKEHQGRLRLGNHENPHLQNAWNKYGEDAFDFDIIEECDSQEELDVKEILIMEQYSPNIYNLRSGGSTGVIFSDDMRKNMSNAQKRRFEIDPSRNEVMREMTNLYWSNPEAREEQRQRKKALWKDMNEDEKSKALVNLLSKEEKQERYSKSYPGVISSSGIAYPTIRNLREFCRVHDLDRSNLLRVINGKSKHHKGWIKYEENVI